MGDSWKWWCRNKEKVDEEYRGSVYWNSLDCSEVGLFVDNKDFRVCRDLL